MTKWTSVKDGLPEKDDAYLVYISGHHGFHVRHYAQGFFWKTHWDAWVVMKRAANRDPKYFKYTTGAPYKKVTHWMPIPELPEELK